jgi:hypothetical protein
LNLEPLRVREEADLLGVDHVRIRLWLFARAAAEPRDNWNDDASMTMPRALAP